MNFKTNKTRLIARVMLLVLLVTSTFSFVGCGPKYKYKFLASYGFDTIIAATAYSDTNVFDVDDAELSFWLPCVGYLDISSIFIFDKLFQIFVISAKIPKKNKP